MGGVTAEVQIIVYGSCSRDPSAPEDRFSEENAGLQQRRVELTIKPKIPQSSLGSMEEKNRWMHDYLMSIGSDVKHSRNWRCEFCTKLARETVWMMASWLHLSPPRMVAYVHNICDAGKAPCSTMLQNINRDMAIMSGQPSPPPIVRHPHKDGPQGKFPISASCAYCNSEQFESRKNLKQCTKCKITRYCGIDCQKPDWERHKEFCKAMKEAKWVWN